MGKHERFNFKLLADLETKCQQLQLDIQFQEDLSPLATPLDVGEFHIPNRSGHSSDGRLRWHIEWQS